jgi:hypothetical protein
VLRESEKTLVIALSIMFLIPPAILLVDAASDVEVRVSASTDDAEEQTSDSSMYTDSSDLELGYDSAYTARLPVTEITEAEHLDKERARISDIYARVKALDGYWSGPIYHNEYVRVRFEENLTSGRDITVYARNKRQTNTLIEVYYPNTTRKIVAFPVIASEGYHKVHLPPMEGGRDTFDLKVVDLDNLTDAYLEFDYIVDPSPGISFVTPTPDDGNVTQEPSVQVNASIISNDLNQLVYRWNETNYTILNDSVVFMMNFDNVAALGESGSLVVDLINGNNGTPGDNAAPAAGRFRGGYVFDGNNDDVTVPDDTAFDIFNGPFTVSVWIKTSSSVNKGHIVGSEDIRHFGTQ